MSRTKRLVKLTPHERFVEYGTLRTIRILGSIRQLKNCLNYNYESNEDEWSKILNAIGDAARELETAADKHFQTITATGRKEKPEDSFTLEGVV